MEDFVKYVGEFIEFFVGGVLAITAITVILFLFWPEQVVDMLGTVALQLPASLGTVFALASLAVAYALGVLIEGTSRLLVEFRLRTITARIMPQACRDRNEIAPDGLKAPRSQIVSWAEAKREEWRRAVEADDAGQRAVGSQLSRLRIERAFLLAGYVVMVALVIRSFLADPPLFNGYLLAAIAVAALNALSYVLVNVRFGRFVKEIVREYNRLHAPGVSLGESSGRN